MSRNQRKYTLNEEVNAITILMTDSKFRLHQATAVSGEPIEVIVTGVDIRGKMFRQPATILMLDGCDCALRSKAQPELDGSVLVEFDQPRPDSRRMSSVVLHGRVKTNQEEMGSSFYKVVLELKMAQTSNLVRKQGGFQAVFQKPGLQPVKVTAVGSVADREARQPNKRRSMRVVIDIPLAVFGQNSHQETFAEKTTTVSVSASGTLIILENDIDPQKPVLLVNTRTKAEVQCRVAHRKEIEKCGLEVGLEFTAPHPKFWGITFPPEDWNPADRKKATYTPVSPSRRGSTK